MTGPEGYPQQSGGPAPGQFTQSRNSTFGRWFVRDHPSLIVGAFMFVSSILVLVAPHLTWFKGPMPGGDSEDMAGAIADGLDSGVEELAVSFTGNLKLSTEEIRGLSQDNAVELSMSEQMLQVMLGPVAAALMLSGWLALVITLFMVTSARRLAASVLLPVVLVPLVVLILQFQIGLDLLSTGFWLAFGALMALLLCAVFTLLRESGVIRVDAKPFSPPRSGPMTPQ